LDIEGEWILKEMRKETKIFGKARNSFNSREIGALNIFSNGKERYVWPNSGNNL
jgi:hypothetical protein